MVSGGLLAAPINIPDATSISNGVAGVVSYNIAVEDECIIQDIDFTTGIGHTIAGDLGMTLETPNGDVVTLLYHEGPFECCEGGSGGYTDLIATELITFDDESVNPLSSASLAGLSLSNEEMLALRESEGDGGIRFLQTQIPGVFPGAGSYQSDGNLTLSDLYGTNGTQGDWTFTVTDNYVFDTGSIHFVQLNITCARTSCD